MNKFYSQSGEDSYLASLFQKDYQGICFDIGAADGITSSNTYYFERHGWTCYCAEPDPDWIPRLKRNRKHIFQIALSNKNGLEPFTVYRLNGQNMGAISSLEVDSRLVEQHKHFDMETKTIYVNTLTLDEFILKLQQRGHEIPQIDFMSIDTEGTELKVLQGFTIENWHPKIMVIENNFEDIVLRGYMEDKNYNLVARIGANDIFSWI